MRKARVLIIYYSFTQQTKILVKKIGFGLQEVGVEVVEERLEAYSPFTFPFKTNWTLAIAMIVAFFRKRMTIHQLSPQCEGKWDCVILGGPTWSYFPSGPILDFLDRYSASICHNVPVIPLISCRSYWRLNYLTLKWHLSRCGATVRPPIVFSHPSREPARLIGLILQLRGKLAASNVTWFTKLYPGYGHNRNQLAQAIDWGREIGKKLLKAEPL